MSGSTRWDMGPTAKFCLSQNRATFLGPRDGHGHRGVHGGRKLTRFGPVLDPRATPPRRSMLSPDSPTRFGWAHSLGRESGGWVSPRDPAPQGAPPATTGLTQATAARPSQMGLSRCLKILVGLMTPVRRSRSPLISEKSNHCMHARVRACPKAQLTSNRSKHGGRRASAPARYSRRCSSCDGRRRRPVRVGTAHAAGRTGRPALPSSLAPLFSSQAANILKYMQVGVIRRDMSTHQQFL